MNRRGFFKTMAAIVALPVVMPMVGVLPVPAKKTFRYVRRTSLPTVRWRMLNQGISPSRCVTEMVVKS